MAESDTATVTEGKLDFDEDNLRGEKKLWTQFPCDRLETMKVGGSFVRIFCENDDEASYQLNTFVPQS